MCENVPEVRMINMYMDHRDNLDDVLNSQTDSNAYCRYSSQVYHYANDVRRPSVILQELPEFDKAIVLHDKLDKATSNEHDTIKATSKGKEKVAEVDGGFVDTEINEVRRSVRKRNLSIQQEADDADDSSENDDESDPDFVDNEYGIDEDDDDEVFLHEVDIDGEWGGANVEQSVPKPSIVGDFVDNEDMFAKSDDEQQLRGGPQSDEESTGHRFPKFNPSCDMGTVEFEVGM
ncbi:hypothetical protein L3X38_012405 [Prunus dulcis]|uniref:Uncharacterized protein n=1 Tax=Prunus dulcis TaxID=3755 RepID=A0AAD4ZGL4_PRUDU|nr:hypothetical protein L3X38_012405 [Prunus dulcis]